MIDPATLTKRYYKIGEVAKMFGVATSLIRYWEGEFDELNPQKNTNGVRRFLKEDVIVVDNIYDLVKKKGFKLGGAKIELKNLKKNKSKAAGSTDKTKLKELKSKLIQLKTGLEDLKSKI